jgi:predicted PurR-regulated permease PerM/GAF domain-containing protein
MTSPVDLTEKSVLRPGTSSLLTAGGIVLAIGALYFGQDIFIPFALAILLSFALTPLVNRLRRLKLPRIAAVLFAVSLAAVLVGGIAFVVGGQIVELAGNLPNYQSTITQKIRAVQTSSPGGGVVERVTTTLQDLSNEISGPDKPSAPSASATGRDPPQEPLTVRLERPEARPLEMIRTVVGPLLAPLATAGLVVIFVIFILLEKEDLRDRFIKLAGAGDLERSTHALNDAAGRVSRYLLMQLVVNLTYGVPIGLSLYFIGIPNAVLWGLLAAILRFVPYLGPFLAALFPITLAVAVDPGWSMLLWVIALFLVAELISNNVVEPWLYGASTGLSSLAIIMAAIFWTTLWGPVGLFLATPLTVCLVVIGRYVPQLEFLGVLLGSDPVLAPEERLYQRLLAGNLEEAVEIAEDYVDEHSSREFYDHVAVPALRLAENDRQRSTTDTNYRRLVARTAVSVVREVATHIQEGLAKSARGEALVEEASPGPAGPQEVSVLCIAGRTELDGAAIEMLAQALEERGIASRILPPIAVSEGALGQLDLTGIQVVCLSYLHRQPQVFARYICRRLRRRSPNVRLVVCCWNTPAQADSGEDLAKQMAADAVVVSVESGLAEVASAVSDPRGPAEDAPPVVSKEERVEVDPLLSKGSQRFDAFANAVRETFDAPIALVLLTDDERQQGSERPGARGDLTLQPVGYSSLSDRIVQANELLVAEDVTTDPRFETDPVLLESGIRFCAGAPLRSKAGVVLGSLCVIDTKPRTLSDADRYRLQELADQLTLQLESEQNPLSGPPRDKDTDQAS